MSEMWIKDAGTEGENGAFLGCRNYPKRKYTRDI